ncbi:protein tyrosine phosphatase 10D [Oratosquilla oratoria]|uniref:protein tyrosine phosphatase 10D n=1 Tax=Oratosquilla oratoria TaxID=337810 RepID=UPI003F7585B0
MDLTRLRIQTPLLLAVVALMLFSTVTGADVFIQISKDRVLESEGFYRLDYWPAMGNPPPNATFSPQEVAQGLKLTRALPGNKYEFRLYYGNDTRPTWTASITTVPSPPTNLSIVVLGGESVVVNWDKPAISGYSFFKLKVISLSEPQNSIRSLVVSQNQLPFTLRELTQGASYELQLYTVYENKESSAYISSNFTTRPNSPGRFIVWYRNETTMLVLWQPPYPAGIYSHYRVSIEPSDAVESVKNVPKNGDPPGPAQAAFHGLVSGRLYNITVETVSMDQISLPTTASYRTIPLKPRNVTFDLRKLTPYAFTVQWDPPRGLGEFDRYQLSIGVRKQTPLMISRNEPREAIFDKNLDPGQTYTVFVKTRSGNVASFSTSGNVTLRPLPVYDLSAVEDEESGGVKVMWEPSPLSQQDSFRISYQEVETFNGDSRSDYISETYKITELYPGRNYSISVVALSKFVESDSTSMYFATRPASPIIEDLKPIPRGLNISWKSDVTSRQDEYAVVYTRNDTNESKTRISVEAQVLLEDLYPGAGYAIEVYAVSHSLQSEPHVYFQAVYPNPVRNLTITDAVDTTIQLAWEPPVNSLFTHYVVRYRTIESDLWTDLPPINQSVATVDNLQSGERYVIQVRSVSHRVESFTPEEVQHTVSPNPVEEITPILDSHNITFEWPRPEGRIDRYTIIWWNDKDPTVKTTKVIPGDKATEGIDRKLSILIGELFPGDLYIFEIFTFAHGVQSEKVSMSTRTKPVITSEIHIVNTQDETRSFTFHYTATPSSVSTFDMYQFKLSDSADKVQKMADDDDRKVIFTDLIPGQLYNITMWTVSAAVLSPPLIRYDRLHPEPVRYINASYISDTDIELTWMKPEGHYDSFEVQYLSDEDQVLTNLTKWDNIAIRNLRPHRNYTFTVLTRAGNLELGVLRMSTPVSAMFLTKESVPGKVVKFKATDKKPSQITFKWALPPNEQNGILVGFTITYSLKMNNAVTQHQEFGPEELYGTITGLIPGKTYQFQIQARTKVGSGLVRYWEETMPIWPPPQPSSQVFPTEVSHTASTINIRYRKNYFSNENGPIVGYAIIVAEDVTKDASGLELLVWRDVQKYSVWPPYQVNEIYYPFNETNVVDFNIGDGDSCSLKIGYCNGPLKPGVTYKVKIRAFTDRNKFADTYYSHPITTDFQSGNVGLAVAIPVLLVVFAVVMLLLLRRRRVGPCVKNPADHGIDDALSIPESMINTSRPVKMRDFAEHYRMMSADSDFRFSEEYEELKNVGREQPCIAADLPVNRPKNRFTNILPYDHSRVKLLPTDDEEGSDYINANYVPGYNSPREFIVTQGALPSTTDDFWRMCWESSSRAIVMLTRCMEKGREKCNHYWPYDTQPVYYGDIQVTILNESRFPDWNISEFRMCKGGLYRSILHFHFTTWPDFGVPDPPQTLVRFVRAFRERVIPDQKPIVVHCSAGVGRSGTFIALDRILHSIRTIDQVDIYGIVYEMRKERVWMVQTEQQYICIHQCLLAVLEGRENDHQSSQIHDNQGFEDDEGIVESGMCEDSYRLQTIRGFDEEMVHPHRVPSQNCLM